MCALNLTKDFFFQLVSEAQKLTYITVFVCIDKHRVFDVQIWLNLRIQVIDGSLSIEQFTLYGPKLVKIENIFKTPGLAIRAIVLIALVLLGVKIVRASVLDEEREWHQNTVHRCAACLLIRICVSVLENLRKVMLLVNSVIAHSSLLYIVSATGRFKAQLDVCHWRLVWSIVFPHDFVRRSKAQRIGVPTCLVVW